MSSALWAICATHLPTPGEVLETLGIAPEESAFTPGPAGWDDASVGPVTVSLQKAPPWLEACWKGPVVGVVHFEGPPGALDDWEFVDVDLAPTIAELTQGAVFDDERRQLYPSRSTATAKPPATTEQWSAPFDRPKGLSLEQLIELAVSGDADALAKLRDRARKSSPELRNHGRQDLGSALLGALWRTADVTVLRRLMGALTDLQYFEALPVLERAAPLGVPANEATEFRRVLAGLRSAHEQTEQRLEATNDDWSDI